MILAGTEGHTNVGRLVNGLEAAKEFAVNDGDELELIFDGAGTQWISELEDEEHDYHDLYAAGRDDVAACDHWSDAFGIGDVGDADDIQLRRSRGTHPSIRSLVDDYEIITL